MASNFRGFAMALDEFAEGEVPEAVRDFRNAIALEVVRGVVLLSPVDTGRLRGNWQVSTREIVEANEREDPGGGSTITVAASAIEEFVRAFDVIYIGNGLDYAPHVNDGTSKVPAVHMVERTLDRITRRFG